MKFSLTALAAWCVLLVCAPVALAQPAAHNHSPAQPPAAKASAAAPAAVASLDVHTREDVQRHRGMAQAHGQAAQCLEAGQPHETCQKQLQAACKGLALGKNCGMRHAH